MIKNKYNISQIAEFILLQMVATYSFAQQAEDSLRPPTLAYIGNTPQGEGYLDKSSLRSAELNKMTAWIIFIPSLENDARKAGADLIRSKGHIDCEARRFHLTSWTAFKSNGEILQRGEHNAPATSLPDLQPNPMRDRLVDLACAKP